MVRIVKTPMDSPPPPPLFPGAAFITVHKTIVTMTAAGDVADYDDTVKAGLACVRWSLDLWVVLCRLLASHASLSS